MIRPYKPYVPKNISEMMDLLGWMMLSSPTFVDDTGFFVEQNIDTAYFSLNEGLKAIRSVVGEERYLTLVEMSDRMRAHFEADPDDKTDDSLAGRQLILDMEELIKQSARERRGKPTSS